VFRSVLTLGQLLEMVLQITQSVSDGWGVSAGSDIFSEWSDQGAGVC